MSAHFIQYDCTTTMGARTAKAKAEPTRPSLPRKAKDNAPSYESTPVRKPAKKRVRKLEPRQARRVEPAVADPASTEQYPCMFCYEIEATTAFPPTELFPSSCLNRVNHSSLLGGQVCWKCVRTELLDQMMHPPHKCYCYVCGHDWDHETIKKFLGAEDMAKVEDKMAARVYERDPTFRWCAQDKCTSGQLHDEDVVAKDPKVCCAECKALNCFQCRLPWHEDLTCEEAATRGKLDNLSENVSKMRENKTKRCPHCSIAVEHAFGCGHMTCKIPQVRVDITK